MNVCPKPVLANVQFLVSNGAKKEKTGNGPRRVEQLQVSRTAGPAAELRESGAHGTCMRRDIKLDHNSHASLLREGDDSLHVFCGVAFEW